MKEIFDWLYNDLMMCIFNEEYLGESETQDALFVVRGTAFNLHRHSLFTPLSATRGALRKQ